MSRQPSDGRGLAAILACTALLPASAPASSSFIDPFHTVTPVGSTVPANGDLNPFGIVTVPSSIGSLVRGDLLISNFHDREDRQGTGTTLVQVTRGGSPSLLAQIDPVTLPGPCPGGVGLTTALTILPHGYVWWGACPRATARPARRRPAA